MSSPLSRQNSGENPDDYNNFRNLAKPRGKYFGTAWQSFYLADSRFGPVLNAQFDQYTPENEMKWEVIQPQRGVFNWTGSDIIFDRAKATGSIVRGHNFIWYNQLPTWVTSITDPQDLKSVMKTHIEAVINRYGPSLSQFDVINEPLNENGTYRNDIWYNLLGEDFIPLALNYTAAIASKVNPNMKLYINDYNIETVNNKSLAHVQIAKKLLSQGVKLDGYGFQCHFVGGQVPKDLTQSIKMFTDLGLDVAITELDIRLPVNGQGIANATSLRQQSKDYSTVVNICLNTPKCPGITVWGVSDLTSWIPGVFPGYGAALLKDNNYQPKPAAYAVSDTLRGSRRFPRDTEEQC